MAPVLMRYFHLLALRGTAATAEGQSQVPAQRQARSHSGEALADSLRPERIGPRADQPCAGLVAFASA